MCMATVIAFCIGVVVGLVAAMVAGVTLIELIHKEGR